MAVQEAGCIAAECFAVVEVQGAVYTDPVLQVAKLGVEVPTEYPLAAVAAGHLRPGPDGQMCQQSASRASVRQTSGEVAAAWHLLAKTNRAVVKSDHSGLHVSDTSSRLLLVSIHLGPCKGMR